MIALTRRYRFPAAHVLRQPHLSEEGNRRLYGECANPKGHGHDYAIEVTVAGPVDAQSGWIIPPDRLDELVRRSILERLGHRLLNEHEWFHSVPPTAENVVRVLRREIGAALAREPRVRLLRLRLAETRRNAFECVQT